MLFPDQAPAADLSTSLVRNDIANAIKRDVDDWCADHYNDGHRNHLGASLIGDDCRRYLWYVFRWVHNHRHPGWLQRLFNRGHETEARFVKWLEGVGFDIQTDTRAWLFYNSETDEYVLAEPGEAPAAPAEDVTGEEEHEALAALRGIERTQVRVSSVGKHFGGSLDGIAHNPNRLYGLPEQFLVEFKTHNAKSFAKLVDSGVRSSKPAHYAQMCVYMMLRDLPCALYCANSKNDDDIHFEVIQRDDALATDMLRKAADIIPAQTPPERISQTPTFWKCASCDMRGVCWEHEQVETNCRSCRHASPVDGGQWACALYGYPIPKDTIKVGCTSHAPIA